jgi:hypothetical protein
VSALTGYSSGAIITIGSILSIGFHKPPLRTVVCSFAGSGCCWIVPGQQLPQPIHSHA